MSSRQVFSARMFTCRVETRASTTTEQAEKHHQMLRNVFGEVGLFGKNPTADGAIVL
jgi:hypothetical protein